MSTKARRRVHIGLAIFFTVQIPLAIWLQVVNQELFDKVWVLYLIFLSLYAIVSTHWVGASAETPTEEE
jgi:formate/nitrite transporter FocA (FNT family)